MKEILNTLGFEENYKMDDLFGHYSEEAILYFFKLHTKNEQNNLSFIESLDVYLKTNMHGVLTFLNDNESVKELLNLEKETETPYLEWRFNLPNKFKQIIEKNIYDNYQKNPTNPSIVRVIKLATDNFYDNLTYTMTLKERKNAIDEIIPAGTSYFGHHFTEFGQDMERSTGMFLYLLFKGESLYMNDIKIKKNGRLKILNELKTQNYLNAEQFTLIDSLAKEYLK
ncbi:MAG: hypothetical protein WC758_01710 [Candidatus Woesearchaeota archaeon]|jgi:hypothetical protein